MPDCTHEQFQQLQKHPSHAHSLTFVGGFRAGIPIAVGYVPIAIAFGLLAKASGIPDYVSVLMSMIVFAGASQFVGVKLITMGATAWEIVMTTFILNFRHFLMSSSLSQRIEQGVSKKLLSLLSFGITDETFAVASLCKEAKITPSYMLGLNLTAYTSWVAGTGAGVFLAGGLPQPLKASMGIALYSMFIGLLVPVCRDSNSVFAVALIAVGVHSLLRWVPALSGISTGWSIIIATIIAALAGAILYSPEEKESC